MALCGLYPNQTRSTGRYPGPHMSLPCRAQILLHPNLILTRNSGLQRALAILMMMS